MYGTKKLDIGDCARNIDKRVKSCGGDGDCVLVVLITRKESEEIGTTEHIRDRL